MEENIIGSFYNGRKYYVKVPTKAKKPWFSLFCSETRFSTILRFDKPSYWISPTHFNIPEEVTPTMVKNLTNFFKTKTGSGNTTYWDKLISYWNQHFPNNPVDPNLEIPDYTKLVYDKGWLLKNFDYARNYRNDFYKKYEESLPKYDIACINVQGGGQESYDALSPFSERGYAIVAAVQGADNCQPLVFMQRPAADFDPADVDNQIEEI